MLVPAVSILAALFSWIPSAQAAAFLAPPPPKLPLPSAEFVREAEKKHERVALLALPSLWAISALTGDPDPASYLQRQPGATQLYFFSLSALVEGVFTLPRIGENFSLKEGITPGQLFGAKPPEANLDALEDVLGRSAMVVVFFILLSSAMM